MSNQQVDQAVSLRVQCIVADILKVDLNKVHLSASQNEFEEWDSMAYLAILSAVEDEFGVPISEENINNFGGIEQIIEEIKKCL